MMYISRDTRKNSTSVQRNISTVDYMSQMDLNEQLMNTKLNEGQEIAKSAFGNFSSFYLACKQTMYRENCYREAVCTFTNHTVVFSPGKVDMFVAFGPRTAYSLYCGHSTFTCLPSSQDNMYLVSIL
jgi:hypothetical protein